MNIKVMYFYLLISLFLAYFLVDVVCITREGHRISNTDLTHAQQKTHTCKKERRTSLQAEFEKFKTEIRNKNVKSIEDQRHLFYQYYQPILKTRLTDVSRFKFLDVGFYATLYDTRNKVPVYSAYKLYLYMKKESSKNRHWIQNPDLSVREQPNVKDYIGVGELKLDRGHLYPHVYAPTKFMKKYTNFITNIALQYKKFNMNTWKRMESALYKAATKMCISPGDEIFFLTGVIPSTDNFFKNMINIPDYFWTAVCCDTSKAQNENDRRNGWSFAYIVKNLNETSLDINMYFVKDFLRDWYGQFVQIFSNYGNVQECLFNPTKTVDVIQEIFIGNKKDRFYLKGELLHFYKNIHEHF
ncbi:unnamed protein product [Mytilus coruscus]|uniref:Uncharacterized protein n=1 Tax=Mytilus coruscus TaxID=42192 RepID=A0A6J8F1F9_MYTCO|nr:unnamed protein product [Mytilus coruscus]